MLTCRPCLEVLLLLCCAALGSAPGLAQATSSQPSTAPTLQVNTQVVLVNVVVTDKRGNPVHGLTEHDFVVSEAGKPQPLKSFQEHTGTAGQTVALAAETPGIFTNERISASSSAVDVLLIDTLNTPADAQPYLRDQLVEFLARERPGSRVAVFAMTSQLHLLQDFTSDPSLLRRAIRAEGVKFSPLLQRDLNDSDAHGEVVTLERVLEASSNPEQRAMLQQIQGTLLDMEARRTSAQTQIRAQQTMQMLREVARYLAGVPGRKNLLWFSGAFPVVIQRDAQTTGDPFAGFADMSAGFRSTVDLLARSQVAVYAIDARGLQSPPSSDLSEDNSIGNRQRTANVYGTTAPNPRDAQFHVDEAAEHSTMRQIAEGTGGRAFYNTNGLAAATAQAVQDGSEYYTLTYALPDPARTGYRSISVSMTSVKGVDLSFRRGYTVTGDANPARPSDSPAPASFADNLAPSAPTATELSLRMQPEVTTTPDPARTVGAKLYVTQPGSTTYRLNVAIRPQELTFAPGPDGKTRVALEYATVLYDAHGKMVDSHQDRALVALDPERLRSIQNTSLRVHTTLTLPPEGDFVVRLLVRDLPGDRIGTLELSAAALRKAAVPAP